MPWPPAGIGNGGYATRGFHFQARQPQKQPHKPRPQPRKQPYFWQGFFRLHLLLDVLNDVAFDEEQVVHYLHRRPFAGCRGLGLVGAQRLGRGDEVFGGPFELFKFEVQAVVHAGGKR